MNVIFSLLLLLTFVSCQKKEPTLFFGREMTMSWQIKVAEKLNSSKKKEIEESIAEIFSLVDQVFNNWNPHSEISKVNQMEGERKILLSTHLAYFLHEVDQLVRFTEGKFDPTIDPLQKLYKLNFVNQQLPDEKELQELRQAVGWNKIHLEGNILWKEHPKTAIDLSGVAKGYAVDLLAAKLTKLGYHNLFVEWGGEVKILGQYSKKREWKIGLENNNVILSSGAVATSGSSYQKWMIDNVVYTHIIDPINKSPLLVLPDSICTVSVQGEECYKCDAIATSLMLFSKKNEAIEWAKNKKITCWISDYSK